MAGIGYCGISADGEAATQAGLCLPTGVATDGTGSLFIADTVLDAASEVSWRVVRKVDGSGIVTTVTGDVCGYSIQVCQSLWGGTTALRTLLSGPLSLVVDGDGNLLVVDPYSGRIRKVCPDGNITTVAGNGMRGFSGDGGPATDAQLSLPWGVAVDDAGHLFIADYGNGRVRKVSPDEIMTTVAGGGMFGFAGDGGPATRSQLSAIAGVAVDSSGNLFIADRGNSRVRKVSPEGIITTVAGDGTFGFAGDGGPATSGQLAGPEALAVDTAGNLFIADYGNRRIRKVSVAGIISTIVSPAHPMALAVDQAGNVFFGEDRSVIRRITTRGAITTVAGNGMRGFSGDGGLATEAQLDVLGIAVDNAGNLFIADYGNSRVRRVSPDGIITTVAGSSTPGYFGDGGPGIDAQLDSPARIAVDSAGDVYVADYRNDAIRVLRPAK